MKRSRLVAIARAAWSYALRTLERPAEIPRVAHSVVLGRAHLGETLNATRFARWLRHTGIDTIIDAGAHTGEFASGIKAVLPDCTVHSFEPQPEACAGLARRLSRYRRVHTYNIALGAAPGMTTLHRSAFSKASSILAMSALHREAFEWTGRESDRPDITVTVDALDNVLTLPSGATVLLKLDVQGYEIEALRGATRTLAAVDYVLVETSVGGTLYEGEARFDSVYRLLMDAGFEFAGTWDQMRDPRNDSPLQIDALFRRRLRV